jgi:subtilisin family serine protease
VAVRGTSFAAPIVAGLLAGRLTDPDVEKARGVLAEFDHEAIDLGSRGVDNVYGHGLLGEHVRVEPGRLAARKN